MREWAEIGQGQHELHGQQELQGQHGEQGQGQVAEALALLHRGLDLLSEANGHVVDPAAAMELVRGVEKAAVRVDALRIDVLDTVDRPDVYRADGFGSAKAFVRHIAGLSTTEAARRQRVLRAMRSLRSVRSLWRQGRLGTGQVDRLARTYCNPRVRQQMVVSQKRLRAWALREQWPEFDARMTDWERYVDEDGARDRNQARHEQRDLRLTQQFDLSWNLEGRCASLQGAQLNEIFRHFCEAELLLDWETARLDHGDDTTTDHLARTDAQRRFDALFAIFEQAAAAEPGGAGPRLITDVVIDEATLTREVMALAGHPMVRTREETATDFDSFRCSTLDGHGVDPTELAAVAMVGHVRRVVVNAASVVVDMGRTQRLFSGAAAVAAKLGSTSCYWPGCGVPVTDCEIDHLEPHCRGGPTDQRNAGPLCRRHNRYKHRRGYHVRRDDEGRWIVSRPDGSTLE